jgi:radical SAM enzyme (TIGR01210 family)
MCPLPNQGLSIQGNRVLAGQYVDQVRFALGKSRFCELLCIYNDGSFFSNHELPEDARCQIYQLAADSGCKYLMVESLPIFISHRAISEAKHHLGDVGLVVAIGLQSVNEVVRELCIASPVSTKEFLDACALLRDFNCGIKVYLLLKPPFLNEDEAICDCVFSANRLHRLGVDEITICPLRVGRGTVVENLYRRGMYVPPALSSIVEVLRALPRTGRIRVSLFNVSSVDFSAVPPRSCADCRDFIFQSLTDYNRDAVNVDLREIGCDRCSTEVRQVDYWGNHGSLDERVKQYLELTT